MGLLTYCERCGGEIRPARLDWDRQPCRRCLENESVRLKNRVHKLEDEINTLRGRNHKLQAALAHLGRHPLVANEGGTNNADRALRVINRLSAMLLNERGSG